MKMLRFLVLTLAISPPAAYGASSPWQTNTQGKVRLVLPYDAAPRQGTLYFGVDFKPEPGWVIYWKNSGDSGYPPKFDFKGSRGFDQAEVLWPRPKLYMLPGDIKEYGYAEETVYPVKAIASPAGKT